MPVAPPTFRSAGAPTPEQQARDYDQHRRQTQHWRRWYKTAAWKKRRKRQLQVEPLCRMCRAQGKATKATTADHVVPHRGEWRLFIGGPLQSLCDHHHSSSKQREERAQKDTPGEGVSLA